MTECDLLAFSGKAVWCLLQVEKESMQTTYTENDRSMLRYVYDCVFFVARKPADVSLNNREDDQPESGPPTAKSPRREGTDGLTWQEMLEQKHWNGGRTIGYKKADWHRKRQLVDIEFYFLFLVFIYFFMMHLCKNLYSIGQVKHLNMGKVVECGIKFCSVLSVTHEKHLNIIPLSLDY